MIHVFSSDLTDNHDGDSLHNLSWQRCRAIKPTGSAKVLTCLIAACLFLLAGCDQKQTPSAAETEANAAPQVSEVPLRIVWTDGEANGAELTRVWNSFSEQPLEIRTVQAEDLVAATKQADLVITDFQQMGDLQAAEAITPLPNTVTDAALVDYDRLLTGLVQNSAVWGNDRVAFPLAAAVPALWFRGADGDGEINDWDSYQQLIESKEQGRTAEPLAAGWAAHSFLYRASSLVGGTWLFERQTMTPLLNDPPYVRALEQLVTARKSYPEQLLTPAEIAAKLVNGELDLAITWPTIDSTTESTSAASNLLTETDGLRPSPLPRGKEVFIDDWRTPEAIVVPETLVAPTRMIAISSSCRQTAIARNFLQWLVSGEGHSQYARVIGGTALIRKAASEEDAGEEVSVGYMESSIGSGYGQLARAVLDSPHLRPILRLERAASYMQSLDEAVQAALAGEKTAEEALRAASEEWERITNEVGLKTQLNNWRRSQGMRQR